MAETNKITLSAPALLLYLLIAFIVGAVVHNVLTNLVRLNTIAVEHDSRLAQIEARSRQIEAKQIQRRSRFAWVGYALQFAGIVCQLLGKFRIW